MTGSWMSIRIRSGRCSAAAASALLAVLGLDHLVAGAGQQIAQDLPVVLLVLDHENALAHARLRLLLDRDRKREREGRALPELGLDPDAAAVHLDDALGDREPEAGAALASVLELSACWNSSKILLPDRRRRCRPGVARPRP